MNSGNLGTIISVIALLVTAATVVGGSFRLARNTQTVSNYRDAAQAWQAKADAQQGELDELKTELAEKQSQISDQQKQIAELSGRMRTLQDMMVGQNALETLRTEIGTARDQIIGAIQGGSA